MTAMISRVKTILATPFFLGTAANIDETEGVWVTAWTENRRLPPSMPSWEDEEIEELFDKLFNSAA